MNRLFVESASSSGDCWDAKSAATVVLFFLTTLFPHDFDARSMVSVSETVKWGKGPRRLACLAMRSPDSHARSLVSSSDPAKWDALLGFFLRSGEVGTGSPTSANALRSASVFVLEQRKKKS
jgi:hypothetical protein